ncbi:MAG: hypothetical protein JWO03_95 [Bacteroidetes bacterium]|nr:hypothetical protein [Bacteroidota bacterium]
MDRFKYLWSHKMSKFEVFIEICTSMRYRALFLCAIVFFAFMPNVSAQKVTAADSIWCDNLNNIIRCVSMKQIFEPVGKVKDSAYINPFVPTARLSTSDAEVIYKRDGKVSYLANIHSAVNKNDAVTALDVWYKKFKPCLALWEEVRLTNYDKSISTQDYFFTNSEDETSVRLSIDQKNGYHVRITIY